MEIRSKCIEELYRVLKPGGLLAILEFSIPMLLGNIVQQLYSAVDSIVVGHFVSVEAMAAIGATSSMLYFFMNMALVNFLLMMNSNS